MVTIAEILLWDRTMGYVMWDEASDRAVFEYTPEFIASGLEVAPLMMPLNHRGPFTFPTLGGETFMGLPGMLADALPDAYGKALLNQWLALTGRSEGEANPVERLCYQGTRSMGALEFRPANDMMLEKSSKVEIQSLVQAATRALFQKKELNDRLGDDRQRTILNIIKVGTSAGGQRAKAVIALNEDTNEIRSGQVAAPKGFAHWLIKLDGVSNGILGDPMDFGRIEFAYYLMALKAGINMTECRLLEENGRAHFMTRRFDRIANDRKVHMQTLCAIAHYDFRRPGAYSYEQALMVMRRMRLPFQDAVSLFRRAVFNVIARNQDDHTKNISFVMNDDGVWRLSPAYDVAWAYNPTGNWTASHQMTINGKRDDITRDDLLALGASASIGAPKASEIIEEVTEAVSHWPETARECGISDKTIRAIGATHVLNLR